ncbi:MAG: J domain-containing protein [candidate division NC10 bacterium]|nr:J domain-containing protein [candidate division NC10 bacterium]
MDTGKDYYGILGVLPTADFVVIRAAYRALAQHYHPDRFPGKEEAAHLRMCELNDAYEVLSDPEKRREYDERRGVGAPLGDEYLSDSSTEENSPYDPLQQRWNIAVEYYPDLKDIESRLSRISWKLAYTYRAYMLEEKAFENRISVAHAIEEEFLRTYFGANPAILSYAMTLIAHGAKRVARELNKAIAILGSNIEARRVITKIHREFGGPLPALPPDASREDCVRALVALGYGIEDLPGGRGWAITTSANSKCFAYSLDDLRRIVGWAWMRP